MSNLKRFFSFLIVAILIFSTFAVSYSFAAGEKITLIQTQHGTLDTDETKSFEFDLITSAKVTISFVGYDNTYDDGTWGDVKIIIKDSSSNIVYSKEANIEYDDTKFNVTLENGSYKLYLTENDDYTFDYIFKVTATLLDDIQLTSFKLNKSKSVLSVGKSTKLSVNYSPSNIPIQPVWSSSNTKVATVDKNGKVTAKALGSAKINVKLCNKSATCLINVTSNTKSVSVVKGCTLSLKSSFSTISGYANATWSSSDKSIATVSTKGVVTGRSNGKVIIKAKINGTKYTQTVIVKSPSIILNKTSATIYAGKKVKVYSGGSVSLKATTSPEGQKIIWSSSNPSVAKVSEKGTVTAVGKGTATIKASFKFKGKTYSKTCKITVKSKAGITIKYVDWSINSADGVEPKITIVNNSKEDIKYITFRAKFYNAVGDLVYDDIGYESYTNLRITGPFKAGQKKTFYWDAVFYNSSVHAINIDNVQIIYMSGKTEKVSYNTLWYDKYYYKY